MNTGFALVEQPLTRTEEKVFNDCTVKVVVRYFPSSAVKVECQVKSSAGSVCLIAVQVGLLGKKRKTIRSLPIMRFGSDGVSNSHGETNRVVMIQAWHIEQTLDIDISIWHL